MLADAYLPSRGFLHRMDPRAKAILLVGVTVTVLVPADLRIGAVLASSIALASAVGLGPREALRPLRTMLPLLFFVIILTPLFYSEGALLVSIGRWRYLTGRGLAETFRYLCRLVCMAEVFYLYFRTTELDAVVASARWFGLPYSACLVLGVAVRLIPSTAALYLGVLDAHSLRRPEPSERRRGLGARVRRLAPAVAAVLVHSVKSIPVLSMALETRGVGRRERRTSYIHLGSVPRMLWHLGLGVVALGVPVLAAAGL